MQPEIAPVSRAPQRAERLGQKLGLRVVEVVPGSPAGNAGIYLGDILITAGGPAERGGLRIGDVLLVMNDTSVSSPNAILMIHQTATRMTNGRKAIRSVVSVRRIEDGRRDANGESAGAGGAAVAVTTAPPVRKR